MVEFKNISVTFKQKARDFQAVKSVSFKIEAGEIYGIVGSSGAGKSTLLRTINLLQQPTAGEIIIDGKNVENYKGEKLRQLRQNIGMIFQGFNLWNSRTVYGNIAFVLRNSGWKKADIQKRVDELLEFVNLTDKKYEYPAKLSGGQKQRVAIARALANNTKILLCDEPTSALDVETTKIVLELLEKINKALGVTIIIITHELDVVKSICSRVAVMNDGNLVEAGDIYDVFVNPQDSFTAQLVDHTRQFEIPEHFLKNSEETILKLTYHGENATNPVLFNAIKRYGIVFSIIHGKIEYIAEKPYGILYISVGGSPEEVQKTIAYFEDEVKRVEVITSV